MYMYVCVCVCMYIYIYIYRYRLKARHAASPIAQPRQLLQRDPARNIDMRMYRCIYAYVYVYYRYIDIDIGMCIYVYEIQLSVRPTASPRAQPSVTGAGIAVHTNPCERLSVRVAVARVALRQCLRLRRVRLSLSVTPSSRLRSPTDVMYNLCIEKYRYTYV